MARPFREHHLLNLLEGYNNQSFPLDYWISQYFRANKALGSKDRGLIAETVYGMIRWQGLLDAFIDRPVSWEKRYRAYEKIDLKTVLKDQTLPPNVRLSFPKPLYELILKEYGSVEAERICLACNTAAPTTVRANLLKTTRDALVALWKEGYQVYPTQHSSWGIIFPKKTTFLACLNLSKGFLKCKMREVN